MAEYTPHYNLIKPDAGESLSVDDYAFTQRNMDNIDTKLYLANEGHHHTGATSASTDPVSPLSAVLVTSSGGIPGGRTVYYKYTIVDEFGQESAASPTSTVTTPAPISTPGAPILHTATAGTLLPGNYFYILTAYKDANTLETLPSNRAYITLSFHGGENEVDLTFPSLPANADGFNIYRRSPGSTRFQYLTSVDMSAATPPSGFNDTGALTEDCNRTIPSRNTTMTANSVTVSLPGATPTVPEGCTWRIYRTYTLNDWDSSLLHEVVEQTSEGSGVVVSSYLDVGRGTLGGKFPAHSEVINSSPSKILLTNAAEVQGTLPVGLEVIPTMVTFTFAGHVAAEAGSFIWVSEFDMAQIMSVRAYLGFGSEPAVQPVIIDVNRYGASAATPSWSSIFANPADRPRVNLATSIGEPYEPVPGTDITILSKGDALSVDVDQAGGGATPTDYNLVVNILLYTKVGSETVSHVWGVS